MARTPPPGLPAALLWDVDGTLAETELDGHRQAFNRAFADAQLPWRWDRSTYLELLRISGGRERMAHFLEQVEGRAPAADRLVALQAAKQRHYAALLQGGAIRPRPGVRRLLTAAAQAGIPQAIVTTSGRSAVAALVAALVPPLLPAEVFAFWVCGEDVACKKPDPEGYRRALEQLGCPAERAVAIEDSANGVAAARAAGLPVLAARSVSSAHEPDHAFAAANAVSDGLGEPDQPCRLIRGPACPTGCITLSYLQQLLPSP
ncbi:MAG: HAD family hydrolase [Synechococcaceae bacterium WB8_1B_136]|nr:HAD family hydrolase [Synechococcaceae bacterium WB8_1B_136]